jgi:hypothetical protein
MDNIRMDLGEVEWGDVGWIGLAKDSNRWRALVNSVLNLRVPWNAGRLQTGPHTKRLELLDTLQPDTGTYPEPYKSSPYHFILFSNIHLNIMRQPTSRSSYMPFSFWLSTQNLTYNPILLHECQTQTLNNRANYVFLIWLIHALSSSKSDSTLSSRESFITAETQWISGLQE